MNLMKLSHINHKTKQTTKGIESKTHLHLKSKTQKPIEEQTMSHEEISHYHFEHVMRNNNSTTPMGTKYTHSSPFFNRKIESQTLFFTSLGSYLRNLAQARFFYSQLVVHAT